MYSAHTSSAMARPASSQRLKQRKPCAEPFHTSSSHLSGSAYPMGVSSHQNGTSRMSLSCITLEEALQNAPASRNGRGSTASASVAAAYTEEHDSYPLSSAASLEVQAALLSQLATFSRELLESAPWDPEPLDSYDIPQSLLPPEEMPTCPVDLMQNLAVTTRQMLAYEPAYYQ